MIIKVIVTASEREGKISGQKYLAFTAIKRDGTKVNLKFRREVEGLPKKAGRYEMELESTAMNLSMQGKYETWWCAENPISVKPYIPEDLAKDQF